MSTKRVMDHIDDRPGDETIYIERGGSGAVVLVLMAVLALVAVIAFLVVQANRAEAVRAEATSGGAPTLADSASAESL